MVKIFKKWSEIEDYLKKHIDSALEDVGEESVEWVQTQIENDVYEVYTPKRYDRKKYNGGLTDPDNIVREVESGTLTITTHRMDGSKNVSYIVISGEGYTFPVPSILTDGRPFMSNLKGDLKKDKRHVEALKKALEKRGFEVIIK